MYNEVFIPNPSMEVEGYDVMTILRHQKTAGDLGIEIECEGNKFPKHSDQLPSAWKYTHDGSLRGKDNAEYVLKKPIKFSEVPKAVEALYKTLSDYGTVLDDSNRTSVHVHLNVQTFHLPRLTAFLALYFSVEEILTEWCGDHRVGNLFCLRAKDAPAIVSKIKKFIVADGRGELTEGLHYSGMNTHALMKFGSLEIRSLRGVTDAKTVTDWVGVLETMYHLSETYKNDPRMVTENFSGNDPIDYLKGILGSYYDVVREGVSMSDEEVRSSMYDGIRLAQDLCYCRDWSLYKEADIKKNPFGRNKKPSAALVSAYGGMDNYLQSIQSTMMSEPGHIYSPATMPQSIGQTIVMPTWAWQNEPPVPATENEPEEYFEPEPEPEWESDDDEDF